MVGLQPVARVARPARAGGEGAAPGAAADNRCAAAEASLASSSAPRSTTTARCATRSPRPCSSISTATCSRSTSRTGRRPRRGTGRDRATRVAVGEGGARVDRQGRLPRGPRASRVAACPAWRAAAARPAGGEQELATEYREVLPRLPPDEWRRIRGEQQIIVLTNPRGRSRPCPRLLPRRGDRERLVRLVRALLADERMRQTSSPTGEQLAMIDSIGESLDLPSAAGARRTGGRKSTAVPATRQRAGSKVRGGAASTRQGGRK